MMTHLKSFHFFDDTTAVLCSIENALGRGTDPIEEVKTLAQFRKLLVSKAPENAHELACRSHFPDHFTASGLVFNPQRDSLLLTHHRKLNRWLQMGGHIDAGESAIEAAVRECTEESGLVPGVSESGLVRLLGGNAIDLDIHAIPANDKEPAHRHFDIRFAFEATEPDKVSKSLESHSLVWAKLNELHRWTQEESLLRALRVASVNGVLASAFQM